MATNGLYDPTVYRKCVVILQRTQLIDANSIAAFDECATTVESLHSSNQVDEAMLGDAPDEFMDPLLWHIMKDPVTLPSGYVIDRSTITQHLMNDPSDPFTRSPLTLDQLVPHETLKAKIDAWLAMNSK
jgi:ubiquitin conjugation factor E4 B